MTDTTPPPPAVVADTNVWYLRYTRSRVNKLYHWTLSQVRWASFAPGHGLEGWENLTPSPLGPAGPHTGISSFEDMYGALVLHLGSAPAFLVVSRGTEPVMILHGTELEELWTNFTEVLKRWQPPVKQVRV